MADQRERHGGRGAGRDERDDDAHERLRRMSSELLEGEGVAERRPDGEDVDVAQQVEPADPAEHDQGRDEPGEELRPASRRRLRRAGGVAAGVAVAWFVIGLYGLFAYGHDYYRYRGFPPPTDPSGVPAGTLKQVHFWSPAMHQERSYLIYLPPGYDRAAAAGMRFPVLYLLHGSPGGGDLFINAAGAGVALDTLIAHHDVRPFMLVMPGGSDGTFMSDTDWANTPHGRYEGLVLDAVHAVDARWPTLHGRRYRGLGGNSEGGFGAVNIALRHPNLFSVVESWSGYFTPLGGGPFAHASAAVIAANDPAGYVHRLAARLRRLPLTAFLYTSWKDRPVETQRFAAALRRAGARAHAALYGGGHTWQLWRSQAPHMILFAGRWFDSPR